MSSATALVVRLGRVMSFLMSASKRFLTMMALIKPSLALRTLALATLISRVSLAACSSFSASLKIFVASATAS